MQDPLANLEIVATNEMYLDPALDMGEAELEEYRKTRDSALLVCKPEQATVRFVVKRIPASFLPTLEGMSPAVRFQVALLVACHEIRLPGGDTLQPDRRQMTNGACATKVAGEEWYNLIATRYGYETCREIGRVAYEHARLPEGKLGPFTW